MRPYGLADAVEECAAAMRAGDWGQVALLAADVDRLDTPPPAVPLGNAALWYAEQGLPVFPIQPHDAIACNPRTGEVVTDPGTGQPRSAAKQPYPGTRGCKDATTDAEQVRAWWEAHPTANVGLATGHVYDVVDIDGLPGQHTRATNWDMFNSLPVVGRVSTPRPGGMHLYVPATGQGNKAGVYPGIDYRGVGGYVLAPPSRTPQGTYRFLQPLGASPAP